MRLVFELSDDGTIFVVMTERHRSTVPTNDVVPILPEQVKRDLRRVLRAHARTLRDEANEIETHTLDLDLDAADRRSIAGSLDALAATLPAEV